MDRTNDQADLNFCYPVEVSRLQNPKLRLVPFDVSSRIIPISMKMKNNPDVV
jgi:hypothetical protein